jgi:hypothetical protein
MEITAYIIEELKLKNASALKEMLPLYPIVRREQEKQVIFKTLVRKKYDGVYYLIPMQFKDKVEAKAIHGIHSVVYKYLMLGQYNFMLVEDTEQVNEVTRLKNS